MEEDKFFYLKVIGKNGSAKKFCKLIKKKFGKKVFISGLDDYHTISFYEPNSGEKLGFMMEQCFPNNVVLYGYEATIYGDEAFYWSFYKDYINFLGRGDRESWISYFLYGDSVFKKNPIKSEVKILKEKYDGIILENNKNELQMNWTRNI